MSPNKSPGSPMSTIRLDYSERNAGPMTSPLPGRATRYSGGKPSPYPSLQPVGRSVRSEFNTKGDAGGYNTMADFEQPFSQSIDRDPFVDRGTPGNTSRLTGKNVYQSQSTTTWRTEPLDGHGEHGSRSVPLGKNPGNTGKAPSMIGRVFETILGGW
jgi:hypothetical protein